MDDSECDNCEDNPECGAWHPGDDSAWLGYYNYVLEQACQGGIEFEPDMPPFHELCPVMCDTCPEYDNCEPPVCGGDGSTCAGCDGVPNSGLVLDECGVCDGDNTTCADCDGVLNGNAVVDECGVCDGDNTTCAEPDPDPANYPDPTEVDWDCLLYGICCSNPDAINYHPDADGAPDDLEGCIPPLECPDEIPPDSCGICGGTGSSCSGTGIPPLIPPIIPTLGTGTGTDTEIPPLILPDMCDDVMATNLGGPLPCVYGTGTGDVCDGDGNTIDDCGVCNGENLCMATTTPSGDECNEDFDVCGVCGGPGIPEGHCDCAGNLLDACGACGGPGIPEGYCDCAGNVFDECDVCNGENLCMATTTPSGDECNGDLDDCGVCDGPGIPEGYCDCAGNVFDECDVCNGENLCMGTTCDDVYAENHGQVGDCVYQSFTELCNYVNDPENTNEMIAELGGEQLISICEHVDDGGTLNDDHYGNLQTLTENMSNVFGVSGGSGIGHTPNTDFTGLVRQSGIEVFDQFPLDNENYPIEEFPCDLIPDILGQSDPTPTQIFTHLFGKGDVSIIDDSDEELIERQDAFRNNIYSNCFDETEDTAPPSPPPTDVLVDLLEGSDEYKEYYEEVIFYFDLE